MNAIRYLDTALPLSLSANFPSGLLGQKNPLGPKSLFCFEYTDKRNVCIMADRTFPAPTM